MKNKQIENKEVLNPCLNHCDWLMEQGKILQFRRLDIFDKTHIDGSPDIEIWLNIKEVLWILMAECKKPVGGRLQSSQVLYFNKYKNLKNVVYTIVTSKTELELKIENLTKQEQSILDSI